MPTISVVSVMQSKLGRQGGLGVLRRHLNKRVTGLGRQGGGGGREVGVRGGGRGEV